MSVPNEAQGNVQQLALARRFVSSIEYDDVYPSNVRNEC